MNFFFDRNSTTLRQLPELPQIPVEGHSRTRRSSSINSHDGTSDLYATVGDVSGLSVDPAGRTGLYAQIDKASSKENGSLPGPSFASEISVNPKKTGTLNEATPSSDSETYTTAGLGQNHAYAKLKRHVEHPYARVRCAIADEETDTDTYDTPPYAESGPRVGSRLSSSGNAAIPHSSTNNRGNLSSGAENSSQETEENGPVPPVRVGRHWRRSSHPTPNMNLNHVRTIFVSVFIFSYLAVS